MRLGRDWEGPGSGGLSGVGNGESCSSGTGGENLFPGDGREREHGAWVGSMDDEEERLGELLFLFFSLFLSFFYLFIFI